MLGSLKNNIDSSWKDEEGGSYHDFDHLSSFDNFLDSHHSPLKMTLYSPQRVSIGAAPSIEAVDH